MRRRPTVRILLVALTTLGCGPADPFHRAMHRFTRVMDLIVGGMLVCSAVLMLAMNVAGLVFTARNLRRPTPASRVGGILLGALNLLLAGALTLSALPDLPTSFGTLQDALASLCLLALLGAMALQGAIGVVVGVRALRDARAD